MLLVICTKQLVRLLSGVIHTHLVAMTCNWGQFHDAAANDPGCSVGNHDFTNNEIIHSKTATSESDLYRDWSKG